jgi:uncharacterized membrane protein YraQ (UPF0718 family)
MSTTVDSGTGTGRLRPLVLTGLALAVALVGLSWAKWLPYTDRVLGLLGSATWEGTSVLLAGEGRNPLVRAWEFTLIYTEAVWKALAVALVVAASVDVLVPRRWLLRVLGGRTPLRGSVVGGLAALPGMMCTCCTAPLAVTLRRAGVPTSAALAFWLGNPVLNPAVLVFLALLVPWPWVAVRVVLGLVLVVGVSALLGHLVERRAARLPVGAGRAVESALADPEPEPTVRELPGRWLRSFAKLALVLVPEYLVVVFVVGLVGAPLSRVIGHGGLLAVLIAAAVAALLVLPTGGEIPILLGLAAAGASAGVLGALLIALPALSLPSMIMVGRALTWRVTLAAGAATVLVGVMAGGLLTVLT